MKKKQKTNALRILESADIKYRVISYDVDESALDAVSVAQSAGLPHDRVYKTIIARGDRTGIVVFCVQGNREIDLKKAAHASGNKKVELIHLKELQPLTGYIRGGCSPVGMKKQYPAYIDISAKNFMTIFVSAGARGMQMELAPVDLAEAAGAVFAEIS